MDNLIGFVDDKGWLIGLGGLSYGMYDPAEKATGDDLKQGIIQFCKIHSTLTKLLRDYFIR